MRVDPGPCPICGAEHTACTSSTGPIAIPQLPARDAQAQEAAPLASEQTPLGPGQFTSATYRGAKGKK